MTEKQNLARAEFLTRSLPQYPNPWKYSEAYGRNYANTDDFRSLVNDCRFFYRRDALASTTVNKMVDIGVNELVLTKNGLSDNEFRVFQGLKQKFLEFSEDMALEFLLSGLVVPEIGYETLTKEEMISLGIYVKRYESLYLPRSMWIRNPTTIKVKQTMLSDMPSYFVEIPSSVINFIKSSGRYPDGTSDTRMFELIKANYPSFVVAVMEGKTEFLLDDPSLVLRRRVVSDSPYPTPFLAAAIDPLKHKRNLRRMDYSVATKVLSSILHVKIGSDEFPMTEAEEDIARLDELKQQLLWRNVSTNEIENIFQFFTDHTVELSWVFPDINALLSDSKYKDINEDIIFALGFPRTLIVGESERTGTSNPEYAAMSPVKTMEVFRKKILKVLNSIINEISKRNGFKAVPTIDFAPINLHEFRAFVEGLSKLFDSGSLSRESFADVFGYVFSDELEKRTNEQKQLKEVGVPEFGASPFSRKPDISGNKQVTEGENDENQQKPSEESTDD